MQAVPSFGRPGRFLELANPFAVWVEVAQMAWFPWAGAARSNDAARERSPQQRRNLAQETTKLVLDVGH